MRKLPLMLIVAAALAVPMAASAQDELDDLEMDVMEAGATPNEASTRVLALPEEASDTARENAQRGLDTANAAREERGEFGTDTAESARDSAGDAGGPPDHAPIPDDLPGGP
jgi:hypothetical protein